MFGNRLDGVLQVAIVAVTGVSLFRGGPAGGKPVRRQASARTDSRSTPGRRRRHLASPAWRPPRRRCPGSARRRFVRGRDPRTMRSAPSARDASRDRLRRVALPDQVRGAARPLHARGGRSPARPRVSRSRSWSTRRSRPPGRCRLWGSRTVSTIRAARFAGRSADRLVRRTRARNRPGRRRRRMRWDDLDRGWLPSPQSARSGGAVRHGPSGPLPSGRAARPRPIRRAALLP